MDFDSLAAAPQRAGSARLRFRVVVLAVVCAAGARAQVAYDSVRTMAGYCRIYRGRPVIPNRTDVTYSLCDVDYNPKRLSGPDLPTPALGAAISGEIGITIRPDGTVDSALTTLGGMSGDTSFANHVLEVVRQWRFQAPLRNGQPVRLGLGLQIGSDGRNDTLSSHLVWRYSEGRGLDTAIGRWMIDSVRPPPLTTAQADSVYAALLRELLRLGVLIRNTRPRYCLVAPSDEPLAVRRLEVVAANTFDDRTARWSDLGMRPQPIVTTAGCERDPAYLRLVIPSIHRTERNRVVLFPRGDFLPIWPPNLDGASWHAWSGRCVGQVKDAGHISMECGVNPIGSMTESFRRYSMFPTGPAAPWAEGDSVRFTVLLATRDGPFVVDTLHFAVKSLPILEQHALVEPVLPCGEWRGFTQSDDVYVVHGAVGARALAITPVAHGAPPTTSASVGCQRPKAADGPVATFLLSGIGARATAPVHLCISDCAYRYVLDPERATLPRVALIRLAALRHQPAVRFRDLRILMDHGPQDVTVLIAFRDGTPWPEEVGRAYHPEERRWDSGINVDSDRRDFEFSIYMYRGVGAVPPRAPGGG